jgi:hypothetical protein
MTSARPALEKTLEKHGLKDDFFGAKDPQMAIQQEKPEHRQVVLLKANGLANHQIARVTGFSKAYVSVILRQPWARSLLAESMAQATEDAFQNILASEVMPSLLVLAELRDDENAPHSVRANCADKILDRALGKPAQTVRTQQLPPAQ